MGCDLVGRCWFLWGWVVAIFRFIWVELVVVVRLAICIVLGLKQIAVVVVSVFAEPSGRCSNSYLCCMIRCG